MKKHLRMTTAALAALGLAIVGCEVEDGNGVDDGTEAPADDGLDDGLDDELTEDPLEEDTTDGA